MGSVTIDKLLEIISDYDEESKIMIRKAYDLAFYLHRDQYRQSGEPYIMHPLNVAYILAESHADADTICAGLLHDVVEDNPEEISLEILRDLFNEDVAVMVNGVTKISKMNFSSKIERNMANTRKIITSLKDDVRIVIIKLADRLHNMRTLGFKSEFKQKENALETMEIFAPLANFLGVYRIKCELEDLSIKYLYPDEYKKCEDIMERFNENGKDAINEMLFKIKRILDSTCIPNEIKIRTKNIYRVYERLIKSNGNISDMHDLIAFKIMVEEIDDCYLLLRPIHDVYKPVPDRFRDYICNPKTNMYQSLHTTVFGPNNMLVQMQLRTFEMDKWASFGFPAYWDIYKGNAREVMQTDLRTKCQFFNSLLEIDSMFSDNQEFVFQVKNELFADKVNVFTPKGEVRELPKGSTVVDFAYSIHTDIGNRMIAAVVNDSRVALDYVLMPNDRVRIITSDNSYGPKAEWVNSAKTTKAKRKIREFHSCK